MNLCLILGLSNKTTKACKTTEARKTKARKSKESNFLSRKPGVKILKTMNLSD